MSVPYIRPNLSHTLCFMFSGKAGTGKSWSSDTAQKLCDKLGLKTFKSPLAYGVKSTATYMGWDGEKDGKGRRLLQDIGKAGRAYDKDMWVRSAFTRIEEQVGYPFDAVFIDDWRFENEYKYVIDNEPLYKVIPIRMDAEDREILRGTPEYGDESETGLDAFSFPRLNYVCNNKNYLFYRSLVEDIVGRSIYQVEVA